MVWTPCGLAPWKQFLIGTAMCILWYLVSFEGRAWYTGQTRGERQDEYQYCVLKTVEPYSKELDMYIQNERSIWSLSGCLIRYIVNACISMGKC